MMFKHKWYTPRHGESQVICCIRMFQRRFIDNSELASIDIVIGFDPSKSTWTMTFFSFTIILNDRFPLTNCTNHVDQYFLRIFAVLEMIHQKLSENQNHIFLQMLVNREWNLKSPALTVMHFNIFIFMWSSIFFFSK